MAGSNLVFGRGFLKQENTGFDIFEIINWSITVASSDRSEKLKKHRDEIISKLYAQNNNGGGVTVATPASKKGIDSTTTSTSTTTTTGSFRRRTNPRVETIQKPKTVLFPKQKEEIVSSCEVTEISSLEKNLGTSEDDGEKGSSSKVVKKADLGWFEDEEAIKLRLEKAKRKLGCNYQLAAKRRPFSKVLRTDELPKSGIRCL